MSQIPQEGRRVAWHVEQEGTVDYHAELRHLFGREQQTTRQQRVVIRRSAHERGGGGGSRPARMPAFCGKHKKKISYYCRIRFPITQMRTSLAHIMLQRPKKLLLLLSCLSASYFDINSIHEMFFFVHEWRPYELIRGYPRGTAAHVAPKNMGSAANPGGLPGDEVLHAKSRDQNVLSWACQWLTYQLVVGLSMVYVLFTKTTSVMRSRDLPNVTPVLCVPSVFKQWLIKLKPEPTVCPLPTHEVLTVALIHMYTMFQHKVHFGPLGRLKRPPTKPTWSKVSSTHLAALKAPTPPADEPASTTFAPCEAVLSTTLSVSLRKARKQQMHRVTRGELGFE